MRSFHKLPPNTKQAKWLREMNSNADQSKRVQHRAPKLSALPPLHILVDTREQTPWVFNEGVTVERVTLSEGDYSLRGFTDSVRVERKSLDDLVGSITVGRERFMAECKRLKDYRRPMIVVEASIDDVIRHNYRSQTIPKSVLASVFAIFVDYGIPTHWAGSSKMAARMVEWMFRRIQDKWSIEERQI